MSRFPGYWIGERTPPEIAAQIRAVYLPRTDPELEDEWTKGWRTAVNTIAKFLESDGS